MISKWTTLSLTAASGGCVLCGVVTTTDWDGTQDSGMRPGPETEEGRAHVTWSPWPQPPLVPPIPNVTNIMSDHGFIASSPVTRTWKEDKRLTIDS